MARRMRCDFCLTSGASRQPLEGRYYGAMTPADTAVSPPMPPGPITDPSAWRGADLKRTTDWIHYLNAAERAELDAALRSVAGRDLLEGIRLGTLHMAVGAGALANFAPAYNVVQLPFLIKNQEHMVKIAEGPAGKLLSQRIEEQGGYKVLGYFSTGDSGIQTVKGPVRTPADLKGVKVRVMENPALIESMRALGANPTPMPFPEV